ncbi:hypothetical protein TIFTF001_035971 [Ficus carica]|uniref:Uncharacterized protein n=1 Tax=Ficus carica TaxID=3494 RepID=A0AA88JAQ4_FICCA|nr:hypothetical protein TIFTF001_035971 [Ficus carica]
MAAAGRLVARIGIGRAEIWFNSSQEFLHLVNSKPQILLLTRSYGWHYSRKPFNKTRSCGEKIVKDFGTGSQRTYE